MQPPARAFAFLHKRKKRTGWLHGGRRQPMCDPEGCATVLGAVGGGGGGHGDAWRTPGALTLPLKQNLRRLWR